MFKANTGRWLAAILALLAIGGIAWLVAGKFLSAANSAGAPEAKANKAPRVHTLIVKKEDLKRTFEAPGSVEGFEFADLYAKIGGYVESVLVDIGAPVKAGQELARLSVPEMYDQLALKQAQINLAEANEKQALALVKQIQSERKEKEAEVKLRAVDLQRVEELWRSRSIVREKVDEAVYQHEKAKAALNSLEARIVTAEENAKAAKAKVDQAKADHVYGKTMLSYAIIKAPFAGVVARRWVHPGAFVQPAEGNSGAKPLLTVTKTVDLRIVVSLPMSEVGWLKLNQKASLRVENYPGEKIAATVARFAPVLNQQARSMRVELALTKPDPRILPGFFVYANITLVNYPDTPVIPAEALKIDAKGKKYVYVVKKGKCHRALVTTLYEDGEKVGIAFGLNGGEEIVAAATGQLADGMEVTPSLAKGKN